MSNIIKGRWRWKDDVNNDDVVILTTGVSFVSNSTKFVAIKIDWSVGVTTITYFQENRKEINYRYEEDGTVKINNDYRIMDFGEADQLIDDELYNFISENAEPYLAPLTIAEKLAVIAENEPKVYDAGYNSGYKVGFEEGKAGDGYGEGFEAGKQAEYDAFWDKYQLNGNRDVYEAAFAGLGWNDETFNPKYPIVVTGSSWNMFYACRVKDGYEILKNVDFSKCTLLSSTFAQCHMKHLGTIDCRNVKPVYNLFYHARSLQTIDKIIVKVENTFIDLFDNTQFLENVTFEGEIGNNLVMAGTYSGTKWGEKLTRASIESIVNHLSDNVSGKTLTLSKAAVDEAFKFDVWGGDNGDILLDVVYGTDENNPYWWILRNTKLNWEIVYS